ncbi:MAG: hypothetical protein Q9227_006491 [Pyrenula ochraceoflavens]
MGKKKSKKQQPLSQEEIWDDSALIRSWNEAVEEYNLYHSIHARGEDVEEVLREAEKAEANDARVEMDVEEEQSKDATNAFEDDAAAFEDGEILSGDIQDSDRTVQPLQSSKNTSTKQKTHQSTSPTTPNGNDGNATTQVPALGPTVMPHELLSGHNEGLKNLMMAWYWAGYYTRQAEEQLQRPPT